MVEENSRCWIWEAERLFLAPDEFTTALWRLRHKAANLFFARDVDIGCYPANLAIILVVDRHLMATQVVRSTSGRGVRGGPVVVECGRGKLFYHVL